MQETCLIICFYEKFVLEMIYLLYFAAFYIPEWPGQLKEQPDL